MSSDREELIELVRRVINPPAGSTQEDGDAIVAEIQRRVARPRITDLIFYPERTEARGLLGGRDEFTPEEVIDVALAYSPIEL
jgi:hypothetical protein